MKNQVLAENKFGHGAKRGFLTSIRRKVNRVTRQNIGRAGIPFDWATGIHRSREMSVSIKNQGQSSSCGGQAKSYWLGIVQALSAKQPYVEQSAKSIYSRIFFPGGGTTVAALARDLGSLNEGDLSSEPPTEDNLTSTAWENASNLTKAASKAGWTVQNVPLDMESIAEAIRDYGAVIFEATGQNNGSWLSSNPKPPSKANPAPLWNHFICGEGASLFNNQRSFSVLQSWGVSVGENGVQYFTQDYLDSGYILDCFTFVKKTPPFIFSQNLRFGMKNTDVIQLQKRLGVWQSGWFGPLTFAAVIFYQKTHGIPETGFVGPLTRQSLLLNSN